MRVSGILLPWQAFLILPFVAILLIGLPFMLIEWLATYIPGWLRIPFLLSMGYVAFPLLLSYVYRRRQFQFGYGGLWYWFYVGFYCLIGVIEMWKLATGRGGLESALAVCVIGAVAGFMIWSAIVTKQRLEQAIDEADAESWDDAVQFRAEAILRAEEMKKERATDA